MPVIEKILETYRIPIVGVQCGDVTMPPDASLVLRKLLTIGEEDHRWEANLNIGTIWLQVGNQPMKVTTYATLPSADVDGLAEHRVFDWIPDFVEAWQTDTRNSYDVKSVVKQAMIFLQLFVPATCRIAMQSAMSQG